MFKKTRECLDRFDNFYTGINLVSEATEEDYDFCRYFEFHLAKAIMSDFRECDAEKIAKIILATLGLSNEIKIKVE